MRIMPLLQAACLSLMLSACVAPLLMMSPTSQLMWALLKPLVGFDPNEANLFEQPMIKDRMTSILGPNYDSTMQLLKTANELQQEGPLFYVVSRYAPVPDVAKQAGMVWNSQTNQMSVMLLKGDGTPQVFGENLAASAPTWPSEMQNWQAQANPTATALSDANKTLAGAGATTSVLDSVLGSIQQGASKTMTDTTKQVVGSATASAQQQASKTVTDTTKQVVGSASATVQQQATKAVTEPAKQTVSSASATVQQQATKAVTEPAKQAVSSASTTVQQQATKAVTEPAKQAASSASATATMAADSAAKAEAARAAAEAEMEALLK
ncbi:hypothetical protein [Aeromonas enterica]